MKIVVVGQNFIFQQVLRYFCLELTKIPYNCTKNLLNMLSQIVVQTKISISYILIIFINSIWYASLQVYMSTGNKVDYKSKYHSHKGW